MKDGRVRYALAFLLFALLSGLFSWGRWEMHPVHFWNRIVADASFALLCLTLIIGPAAQFIPRLWPLLPWRRELGVVAALAALAHVIIYMRVFRWNPMGFFFRLEAGGSTLLRDAFASSNWVGLLALAIMLVLGVTANDLSQRWLGRGWKFLQQQNYTLFALTVMHVLLFLYLVYQRRGPERDNLIYPAFWWLTLVTVGFQTAGYIRAVWLNARRRGIIRRP